MKSKKTQIRMKILFDKAKICDDPIVYSFKQAKICIFVFE